MTNKEIINTQVLYAKQAISEGNYNKAITLLRELAIKCLEVAKVTFGIEREDYYNRSSKYLKAAEDLECQISKPDFQPKKKANDVTDNTFDTGCQKVAQAQMQKNQSSSVEDVMGKAIRPERLSDYIGQEGAVNAVKDSIKSAKLRGTALQHIMLFGGHGLGKTTFARIIANEMGVNFVELNVSNLSPSDLIKVLSDIHERDIVFIDEIHNIPQETAESVLYSAMEDFQVCYAQKNGNKVTTIKKKLPRFTLIGATTEIGKMPKPFIARAGIQCRLQPFNEQVLADIITGLFDKLGMSISQSGAMLIAARCRNNPRVANRHFLRIADKAICQKAAQVGMVGEGSLSNLDAIKNLGIHVDEQLIEEFFVSNGIDEIGLEEGDRQLMNILINNYGGGPVSLDTLAKAMGESANIISEKYEDYLIKKGMIKITSRGRVATERAYKHFGISCAEQVDGSEEIKCTSADNIDNDIDIDNGHEQELPFDMDNESNKVASDDSSTDSDVVQPEIQDDQD